MSPQTTACRTITGNFANTAAVSAIASLQFLQIIERLIDGADDCPRHSAFIIKSPEQHQVIEIRRRFQRSLQLGAQLAGSVIVSVHVVSNKKMRPLRD